jgi:ribosome-binding protein aMBF1 (putative translation factor)
LNKPHSRKQRAVAETIAEARVAAGFSQRGLSAKLEKAGDYFWKIENYYREVLAVEVIDIAHALGTTAGELMERAERRLK